MPIEVIFKTTQPDEYEKMKKKYRHSKPKKKIKISDKEAEELMEHSSYKRKGRALRQVR